MLNAVKHLYRTIKRVAVDILHCVQHNVLTGSFRFSNSFTDKLMRKGLLSFCLVLTFLKASSQTCVHTSLSKSLLFKTQPKRLKRADGFDSCRVRITVVDKLSHHTVFTTILASGFLFNSAYATCEAARFYTTDAGRGTDVKDYDYGDVIVADFNFDGREDFAAKNDSGGNRGPTYKYYIQNSAGSFELDKFLTERMGHFPDRVDKPNKTLILESDDGLWHFKTSYQLNAKTGRWREIKHDVKHTTYGSILTETN